MAGLVPAIHVARPGTACGFGLQRLDVDARNPHVCGFRSWGRKSATADFRHKAGHDGGKSPQ